jgi:hypothetical protein
MITEHGRRGDTAAIPIGVVVFPPCPCMENSPWASDRGAAFSAVTVKVLSPGAADTGCVLALIGWAL